MLWTIFCCLFFIAIVSPSWHLLTMFVTDCQSPLLTYELHKGTNLCLVHSMVSPKHLKHCLPFSKYLSNEWIGLNLLTEQDHAEWELKLSNRALLWDQLTRCHPQLPVQNIYYEFQWIQTLEFLLAFQVCLWICQ